MRHHQAMYVDVRRNRGPNHIKSIDELRVGQRVVVHEYVHSRRSMSVYRDVVVDVGELEIVLYGAGDRGTFKLGLANVNGKWHKLNWLERVEE